MIPPPIFKADYSEENSCDGANGQLDGSFGTIGNMEQWRVNVLRCLGIDFSESALYKALLILDNLASYRGYYSNYLNGILFVNGTVVSKGDAFLSFIEKTKLLPERIIFIDDSEDNLKSLEAAILEDKSW